MVFLWAGEAAHAMRFTKTNYLHGVIMAEDSKRVGSECRGFRARLLSRVITAVYDDALAEGGLKVSQFSVLNAIASREETRPAELAKVLGMDESTLSRNVARMCARRRRLLESGGAERAEA